MKKFSEIEYVRPDLSAYREEAKAHIENIKNAESYEELKNEMLRYDELQKQVMICIWMLSVFMTQQVLPMIPRTKMVTLLTATSMM